MFEFFLALFGGGYILNKYISDRIPISSFDKEMRRLSQNSRSINKYIATPETELEIRRAVSDVSQIKRDEITEDLSEDFHFVFGEDWRRKIRDISRPSLEYWERNILLAKMGRIPWFAASEGYQLGCLTTVETDARFCQDIERVLMGVNGDNPMFKLYVIMEPPYYLSGYKITDPKAHPGRHMGFFGTQPFHMVRLW